MLLCWAALLQYATAHAHRCVASAVRCLAAVQMRRSSMELALQQEVTAHAAIKAHQGLLQECLVSLVTDLQQQHEGTDTHACCSLCWTCAGSVLEGQAPFFAAAAGAAASMAQLSAQLSQAQEQMVCAAVSSQQASPLKAQAARVLKVRRQPVQVATVRLWLSVVVLELHRRGVSDTNPDPDSVAHQCAAPWSHRCCSSDCCCRSSIRACLLSCWQHSSGRHVSELSAHSCAVRCCPCCLLPALASRLHWLHGHQSSLRQL